MIRALPDKRQPLKSLAPRIAFQSCSGISPMNSLRSRWLLEDGLGFLNHGSFGACPKSVLEEQSRLRAEMEREPVRFLWREIERHIDGARAELARFLGVDAEDLAFVPNATTAVNSVLRSLDLQRGDQLIATDHGY